MSVKDDDSFSRAGDVIKTLFDKISGAELEAHSNFNSGWKDIVGEEVAFHVMLKDIINGTLILEADHPGWSQRICMSQKKILQEIRKRYPELDVRKLRVRTSGDQPQPRQIQTVSHGLTELPPQNRQLEEEGKDRSFFDLLEELKKRGSS